ncbi:MAG: NYN domain-containing protein [Chloroflexi bacterium]|nr:NYN domain-containing protein [Chloroflexota bacterium]
MSPKRNGVMVLVDWENIRLSIINNFKETVTPRQVIDALKSIAGRLGEFRGGYVFGDWTLRSGDAREIEENEFRAENVLLTRGGKDRSDVPIALKMDDLARTKADIKVIVLCSGDAGFAEVIRRAKEHGKDIYVCAITLSAARELVSLTKQVFPLEAHLNLTPKLPPSRPSAKDMGEWRLFIERLGDLEKKLPYVVHNYLRDKILDASMGCGQTAPERDEYLKKAATLGIILEQEMPNPKMPGRTVTTCRLNKENEVVKKALS